MIVYYFDSLPTFDYVFRIYRVDELADVHDMARISSSDELDSAVHIEQSFSGYCCSCMCSTPQPRYWAASAKESGSVLGVRSSIETRYGKLCRESISGDTTPAFATAWIGINEEIGSKSTPFVQCGYMHYRGIFDAGSNLRKMLYLECRLIGQSEPLFFPCTLYSPWEGATPEYELIVTDNREWIEFRTNGDSIRYVPLWPGEWLSNTGNWVTWSGEIRGWETDMPGTESDPCSFTSCRFKRDDGQGFRNASFSSPPDLIGTMSTLNEETPLKRFHA